MSGLPVEQISAIPNGIDTDFFVPGPDRASARLALNMPVDEWVIILVARLAPEKDLGTLLRAFAIVHRQVPAAALWIVGEGPEKPILISLSRELGIEKQTRFLGARNDVRNLLQAADVFALTSLSEGLSIALIEASACGLPIVATNVGGNPEIVEAPHGGVLVEPTQPEKLAEALAALLQDGPRRDANGRHLREQALRKYSLATMTDRYCALYDRILTGNRSQSS